ncbi:MAG: acetyltransferase [Cytophagales bacterium]|nr:acetyltransferase [Cytophagales bacterium]
MQKPVLIIGAKNLGVNVLEILLANDAVVYGFLEDDTALHNTEIHLIPVLGSTTDEKLLKVIGSKAEVVVAIENGKEREHYTSIFEEDYKAVPVNVLHPKASVSKFAVIHHGNIFMAGCVVSAGASLGSGNILGANSFIDSGALLDSYCYIGANSCINQDVHIAKGAYIGTGCTVVAGVKIGRGARIGAGSVVMADVKGGQTVFGVPAVAVNK